MRFRHCESFLFSSILFAIIAVTLQSDDGETNVSYAECQWKPFSTGSKRECAKRCSGYFGFWDEVSNKLICYHDLTDGKPINENGESCECGYVPQKGHGEASPCIPEKEFKNVTNVLQCKRQCRSIKVYKYLSERRVKVSYCDDSNKIIPQKLEKVRKDKKMDRFKGAKKNNPCQCALAVPSVLLNLADSPVEKPEEDNREIAAPPPIADQSLDKLLAQLKPANMCQMGEFKQSHKKRCTSNCHKAKAFIPRNSAELVCYHGSWLTEAIPSDESCQCGIIVRNTPLLLGSTTTHKCVPEVIHRTISANSAACNAACRATTAFVFNSPNMRVTRCEPDNQEPSKLFDKLEPKIGLHRFVPTSSGKGRSEYPCECGVDPLLPMDLNRRKRRKTYWSSTFLKYDNATSAIAEYSKSMGENSKYHVPMVNADNIVSNYTDQNNSAIHRETGSYDVDLFDKITEDDDFRNLPINLLPFISRNDSLHEGCTVIDKSTQFQECIEINEPNIPIIPEIGSFDARQNTMENFLNSQSYLFQIVNRNNSLQDGIRSNKSIQLTENIEINTPTFPVIPEIGSFEDRQNTMEDFQNSQSYLFQIVNRNNSSQDGTKSNKSIQLPENIEINTPTFPVIPEIGSFEDRQTTMQDFQNSQSYWFQIVNRNNSSQDGTRSNKSIQLPENIEINTPTFPVIPEIGSFETSHNFNEFLPVEDAQFLSSRKNTNVGISNKGACSSHDSYYQESQPGDYYYLPNEPAANNKSIIPKAVGLQPLPNNPANNDLYWNMGWDVFPTIQITPPQDLNPPSSYDGMGSLESLTNYEFTTPASNPSGRLYSPSIISPQPKEKRLRLG